MDNDALDPPRNRAISFSSKITYGLYEVTDAPADNWAKVGDKLILADKLADEVFKTARVQASKGSPTFFRTLTSSPPTPSPRSAMTSRCPSSTATTSPTTRVPLRPYRPRPWPRGLRDLDPEPAFLEERGINPAIPYTVDEDSFYTAQAPGFAGKRVITEKGETGDANKAVIEALVAAGSLLARGCV